MEKEDYENLLINGKLEKKKGGEKWLRKLPCFVIKKR